MSWFKRIEPAKPTGTKKASVPTGVWRLCPKCGTSSLAEDVARHFEVCPSCGYHFRIRARPRLDSLFDDGRWTELEPDMTPVDRLKFTDRKSYTERIAAAVKKTKEQDAFVLAEGEICEQPVVVGTFEFAFMGGSMGSVVGEKVTRAFEYGLEHDRPVVVFSASGGARMQEGILSLMQMAKTSAAISRFRSGRRPYISVLTDPTTGGVAASFALLGDVIIAEPGALVGFAGPRVIEQTIRQTLPEGFQRSEFLLEHGVIDRIVPRDQLRSEIGLILGLLHA